MAAARPHIPRPATALVALARAMALDDAVSEAEAAMLTEAVCRSRGERAALISALSDSNSAELSAICADLVAAHAAALRAREAGLSDLDEIAGLWGLRFMTGALLFVAGGLLSETIVGGAGLLALTGAGVGAAAVAFGRLRLRARRNGLRREREVAEGLSQRLGR